MPLIEVEGKKPIIGDEVYIAPNAYLIGDVRVDRKTIVLFGAVLRGDLNTIEIGGETSIQDNVVIHPTPRSKTVIGSRVVIGHGAIIEGAIISDGTMIGIGAVILDGAKIGRNCIVGAGAVVRESMVIPDNSIVVGVPAKIIGHVKERHLEMIKRAVGNYQILREKYIKEALIY